MAWLLLGTMLEAAPVSKESALQKAADFVASKSGRTARGSVRMVSQLLKPATDGEQAYWYVFNVGEQQGFVVVSGDDRTDEILGYADSGSFSEQDMPENMRSWLQGYADDIKYLDDHGITDSQARQARGMQRTAAMYPVAPMTTTKWNQDEPYNLQCPEDPVNDNELSVTGCVATAFAQVLYWYAKNRVGGRCGSKEIAAYTTSSNKISVPLLDAIKSFDWDNMQDSYRQLGKDETEESLDATEKAQRQAVAQLMRYCGQSVQMNYSASSSGATTAYCANRMITYFGYDDATKHFDRKDYYYADWIQMMYHELTRENGGPILYHGTSTGGGHAFVIDGYDYDDYFHVNWGWGGKSNGYFKLSILYSKEQGIGGSTSTDGFTRNQGAILNVNPVDDGEAFYPTLLTATEITCEDQTINFNTPFSIQAVAYNFTGSSQKFSYALGMYQDGVLKYSYTPYENTIESLKGKRYGYKVSVDYDETTGEIEYGKGTYLIYPICKLDGTEVWQRDENSEKHFVTMVIGDDGVTITSNEPQLSGDITLGFEGNMKVNNTYDFTVDVTNNGGLYSDVLTAKLVSITPETETTNTIKTYQTIGATSVTVAKGAPRSAKFSVVPPTNTKGVENLYLIVTDVNDNIIAQQAVMVEEDDASDDYTLVFSEDNKPVIEVLNVNEAGTGILGNTMSVKVSVKNSSTETDYSATGKYVFYLGEKGASSLSGSLINTPIYVPKGETRVFEYSTTMDIDKDYRFGFYPNKDHSKKTDRVQSERYSMAPAVYTYEADGTVNVCEISTGSTFVTPEGVTSINLSGAGLSTADVKGTVIPNSNPNTLYFFDATDEDVNGLEGRYVVKGGTAATITLADGNNFATPMDFTATEISYTRSNFPAANLEDGWTTIVLPFDVTSVTANGKEIDWFHSSNDRGKNFWVREFISDSQGTVMFAATDRMKANTPYIIALPGNAWGEKWNLADKTIVFHGANAAIASHASNTTTGNDFKFVGSTTASHPEEPFVMNEEGDNFVKQHTSDISVEPFRAWLAPQNWLAMEYDNLTMFTVYGIEEPNSGVATGISEQLQPARTDGVVYNLRGQKVRQIAPTATFNPLEGLPKGIYIVNGKKMWNK